ncbi:MAG: indole-3-glycerol phosphate synthase TrpC [Pseudomonadota bacterium]
MVNFLEDILAEKKREVERLKKESLSVYEGGMPPVRDFKRAVSTSSKVNLIAEIKFASPSAGIIRKNADPIEIGRVYEEAGAAAISILTDKTFFRGDRSFLPILKRSTSLPLLRKDFIIDEIQLRESSFWGADAVLLIARILSEEKLRRFLYLCQDLGMAALTEVHDKEELEKAIDCGAEIIGINNRNLDTFQVNLQTTLRLAPLVPEGSVIVSESGIRDRGDIQLLKGAGVHAVLVGTSLMRSRDVGKKAREFTGKE